MVNPDLFESYLHLTLPKDLSFISGVNISGQNKSNVLSNLTQYSIIKQRVDDFYSDRDLMNLYSDDPLDYVNSEILKKDVLLSNQLDSRIKKLKDSVNNYSGNNSRKFVEVESELEFISLANSFIGSDVDVDLVKNKIRKKLYSSKKFSSNKFVNKNFNYRNLVYGALLIGGMYVGHSLFPKERRIYTTINKDVYENPSIPLDEKMNQFVYDRNLLLKYEYDLVQSLVDKHNSQSD